MDVTLFLKLTDLHTEGGLEDDKKFLFTRLVIHSRHFDLSRQQKPQVELMILTMALFHLCVPVSQQGNGTQPSLIKGINHTCACLPGWRVTAGGAQVWLITTNGCIQFRFEVRFLLSIAYCMVPSKEKQQLQGERKLREAALYWAGFKAAASQQLTDWNKQVLYISPVYLWQYVS